MAVVTAQEETIRILLVEDDRIDRMAFERMVREKQLPYEVAMASSLTEGVEILKKSSFDVVLLDYNLGDGTGPELIDFIKDTPVIFVTGSGNEEIAALAIRRGAYDYLIKDADRNDLTILPGTIKNVLTRKRAEDALKESEERYRQLVELSPDAIMVHSEGKIAFINSSGAGLLGAESYKEIVGMPLDRFIHPDYKKSSKERILMMYEKGETVPRMEEKFIRLDGTVIDVEVASMPLMYKGEPAVQFVARDVTKRIQAERELKEAKEKAEDATRLKDKFVTLVSHDLREPLASMIGFLKLMNDKSIKLDSPEKDKIMGTAIESGEKMNNMIEELLNISRLKTGKIQVNFKFIDAHLIALKVMSELGQAANKKGIELANKIPKKTRIYADPDLLCEVIRNLVSNSIKFSGKGDKIEIFTPKEESSTIAVSDSGAGIGKERLDELFNYETKTSTVGTGGETGTGLGLPLSKDIMDAHNGTLAVESNVKKGSTFYARLSVMRPVVLVIEDDHFSNLVIREILEAVDDVETLTAANGKEGMSILQKKSPHLILLDLLMPEMDGFEFIKYVKNEPNFANIPMIVLTANEEAREKVSKLGVGDFIVKPISTEELTPRVKKYIL